MRRRASREKLMMCILSILVTVESSLEVSSNTSLILNKEQRRKGKKKMEFLRKWTRPRNE